MTVFRPQTQVQAAQLLIETLNYISETSGDDFSFGPLTVDKIISTGFEVTPLPEPLSHILRQVVDSSEPSD